MVFEEDGVRPMVLDLTLVAQINKGLGEREDASLFADFVPD